MSARNWFLLLILSILWGGSFFFVEVALEDLQPFTLVFYRIFFAALALTAVIYCKGQKLPTALNIWGLFFVMGLLNNVIPFALIVWGQTQITGSVASILNAATPIFTVLVAHFMTQDERLSLNKIIGILLGFTGVYLLMVPTLEEGLTFKSYGQIAILGATISYAFAGVWGKRLKSCAPSVNASGMLICSSIIMLPLVIIFDQPFEVTLHTSTILSVAAIAFLSTALAYILYFQILASAGATNLLLVTFLVPVSAMALGILILGEHVHFMALLGMAVIFSGLAFIDGRVLKFFKKN